MKQSKLLSYFKTFQSEEWRLFMRFLKSPYHNNNEKVIRLTQIIRKDYPDFNNTKLTKDNLQKKLGTRNLSQLTNLMIQTRQLIEQFWQIEQVKKEPKIQSQLNLKNFEARRLDKAFDREVQAVNARLLMQSFRDMEFHQESLELNKRRFFNLKKRSQNETEVLEQLIKHLEEYIIWEILQWNLIVENRGLIKNDTVKFSFFTKAVKTYDFGKGKNEMLKFFKKCNDLLKERDEVELDEVIELFFTHFEKISPRFRQSILLICLNSLAFYVRNDDSKAIKNAYRLYKFGFEYGLLLENQILPSIRFINMINIGCLVKDFKWTEFIIDKSKTFLSIEERDDLVLYAEGYCYFHEGLAKKNLIFFEKTIEKFQNIEDNRSHYAVRMRSIIIRCYYELFKNKPKSIPFILKNIELFEVYLRRKQNVNDLRKEAFYNFTKFLKKIITLSLKRQFEEKKIETLLKQIAAAKNLFARNWLKEKIEELRNSPIFH